MQNSVKNIVKILLLLTVGLFQVVSSATWYTTKDGRQYLIEESASYNWLQAMDQCSRRGLQLVINDNASKDLDLRELLNTIFGTSRNLWIGHHDEFNRNRDKNRAWYSAASGTTIAYKNWYSGEPNNYAKEEHCAVAWGKTGFSWNDEPCDTSYFGYICEEHYKTTQCRNDVESKRKSTNQKNSQLSQDFTKPKTNVQTYVEKSHNDTDNLLQLWEKSAEEILENFEKSLNELILKKPYLQAVVADVGATVKELVSEAKVEMTRVNEQTRHSIADIQLNSEKSVNNENSEFAYKIEAHNNEIDTVMAI